ncbi:hypothetical protein B0E52_03070 [Rhodanobacter sp. C06]|uniref:glycosyltransferase n=1 Tax=Rhodanobacter sp. C06 TaxID=1945854 RepID=UPI0009840EB5|nr:glycosyltransferase [Rhodanobacter sp. C06]OOG48146.1 hypothetical protein B0E52_03070 [Rhodanobacter sp. C06]
MRILLIAYNYPPQASPQAIRWYYLSRELARRGAEVHVLAPDIPAQAGAALDVPAGVTVHRCDAGGLAGWLARAQRRRHRNGVAEPCVDAAETEQVSGTVTLNWKGRWLQRLQRWVGLVCFPDNRGQWRRPARAALDRLIETLRPDILISSHEPAVTLELGLSVAARVPAWLADLGDPVLTSYTPPRWRRRAWRLEEAVCRAASVIGVTTDDTRELLRLRHGVDAAKIFVLSQGFDDSVPRMPSTEALAQGQFLHLLYSGRFYPFRDPVPLLEAVVALDRVHLTVIAPEVKPELLAYAERSGGRIVFAGEQPHGRVLAWQRECDVLVNIGNALQAQVPGKLFEYLGSGKPVLHCQSADEDPAVMLLAQWGCGWVCRNEHASLQALLAGLLASPMQMVDAAAGNAEAIARHGWSRLGGELFERCGRLVTLGTTTDAGH